LKYCLLFNIKKFSVGDYLKLQNDQIEQKISINIVIDFRSGCDLLKILLTNTKEQLEDKLRTILKTM